MSASEVEDVIKSLKGFGPSTTPSKIEELCEPVMEKAGSFLKRVLAWGVPVRSLEGCYQCVPKTKGRLQHTTAEDAAVWARAYYHALLMAEFLDSAFQEMKARRADMIAERMTALKHGP